MEEEKKRAIYAKFNACVNLAPRELEDWLATEKSHSVGDKSGGSESTGHQSGRRILEIKRTRKAELSDEEYQHMSRVIGYVHRHLAQRPRGDVEHTRWRYSLMNWGHDPLKHG